MSEKYRPDLSQLFRPPVVEHHPGRWLPRDPHEYWINTKPSVGLSMLPPQAVQDLLPLATLHGRFVENAKQRTDSSGPPDPYALVSLRRSVKRLPPHPGVRPPQLGEYTAPHAIYFDGSGGPYEQRRIPQEYLQECPWGGFHVFLPILDPSECPVEHWDVADFFNFNSVRSDAFDGDWIIPNVSKLLDRRTDAEILFTDTLQMDSPCVDVLREEFGTALPFLDNLDMDEVRSWKCWMDGRDAIGRTLRYVAEVLAMVHWLKEVQRQGEESSPLVTSPYKFMGVWVGDVCTEEAWTFLIHSPLPLYALFSVANTHPLYRTAMEQGLGQSLDADEQYRLDSFTSALSIPSLRRDGYDPQPRLSDGMSTYLRDIPHRQHPSLPDGLLQLLPPGDEILSSNHICISARLSWTSYIHHDSLLHRPDRRYIRDFFLSAGGRKLRDQWKKMIASTTRIPCATMPRPIVGLHARDLSERTPETERNRFSLGRLGPVQAQLLRNAVLDAPSDGFSNHEEPTHHNEEPMLGPSSIHFEGCGVSQNDPSACKMPGPPSSLGSIPVNSAGPLPKVLHDSVDTVLVDSTLSLLQTETPPSPPSPPARNMKDPICEPATLHREGCNVSPVMPSLIATPYSSSSPSSAQVLPALPPPTDPALAVLLTYTPSTPSGGQLPIDDITMADATDQSSQRQDDAMDISQPGMPSPPAAAGPMVASPLLPALGTQSDTTWQGHSLVAIREGRLRAEAYTANCLNSSSAPATKVDCLVTARLTHHVLPLRVVCYPLRFENVFLPTRSPISVIQDFLGIARLHFGDIVLISVYLEVDGSSTIDVGFRFADEALIAWQRDGFLHNSYYWKISPIASVGGHCFLTHPPDESPRSRAGRVLGLRQAMELESHVQACSATDPVDDDVSTQMQQMLQQLNTVNPELWGIACSGSPPTSTPNLYAPGVEIQPRARCSDWAIVPGPSMMSWMRTWALPCTAKPDLSLLTSRQKRRAHKLSLSQPVDGEDHQTYRANYHIASKKFQHWHGGEIQLSPLPRRAPVDHSGRRDPVEAYAEIWDWYEDSLVRINAAYARYPSLAHISPSLSELPTVSTTRQREDAVRGLSYDTLRNSFSLQERLHSLSGDVHTAVMKRVSS